MSTAGEPQPVPLGDGKPIFPLVLDDIRARVAHGLTKYKSLLRADNGRDALMDAYREAIDLVMYLRQAMYERDGK